MPLYPFKNDVIVSGFFLPIFFWAPLPKQGPLLYYLMEQKIRMPIYESDLTILEDYDKAIAKHVWSLFQLVYKSSNTQHLIAQWCWNVYWDLDI